MSLQKIGKMSLKNSGAFVAKIRFSYQNNQGKTILSEKSGDITLGFTKTIDPGELGVPDGSIVQMIAFVVWGKDNKAPTQFHYVKGNPMITSYEVSGKIWKNNLVLLPGWKNWSENIVYTAPADTQTYYYPRNREALKDIVLQAAAKNITLRTSGQRHSQPALVTADNRNNPQADPNTWLVDLSCFSDLGSNQGQRMMMDTSGSKVTVNTGVREDELDEFLTTNNRMLKTVTAGGFFSLGGMTAVDVHGATVNEPIFAETASAFTIMGPDGKVTTIDVSTPADDGWKPIQFARVSLGALGIVTSVTLEVDDRPLPDTLKPGKKTYKLDNKSDFISTFKDLVKHTRIETFYNPYSSKFLALWWDAPKKKDNKDTPIPTQALPTACELAAKDEFGAPYEGPGKELVAEIAGLEAQDSGSSAAASLVMDLAFLAIEDMFKKASEKNSDLWLTKAARTMFMSYFVELPDLDDAGLGRVWDGLNVVANRLSNSAEFMLAGPMEFRFIKGGDTAMAGTYTAKSDSTFVNLDLIGFVKATPGSEYPPAMLQFFADIERAWVAMGGIPHNGKMYGFYDPAAAPGTHAAPFNSAYISDLRTRRGERLQAFEAYRSKCDPKGMFSNGYVRDLLGWV